MPHFSQGTGLAQNGTEYHELFGNWSLTTWAALEAVQQAGGYTWSNVNCELDPIYWPCTPPNCPDGGGYVPSGKFGCGLTKTNGSPRATNNVHAPVWDGRKGNDMEPNEDGRADCAPWLREACSSGSVFGEIPTMVSFTAAKTPRHNTHRPGPAFPALEQDVARL